MGLRAAPGSETDDVLGREVSTPVTGAYLSAGPHEVLWKAYGLTSGAYLYNLTAGSVVMDGRMILLK